MGRYDSLHGDEDEIESSHQKKLDAYDDEHSSNYKYTEEWINEKIEN